MEVDGLSAEVLYPTLLLSLYALKDAGLQEACFRLYNDWLIEYCSVDRRRLVGVPAISVYDVGNAVKELERCRRAGLKGALIWQAPHPDLPFHSAHYDKFWAAAEDLDAPVSMHILTGHSYHGKERKGIEHYRGSVNLKLADVANALFDFIFYGVLERHPKLKLVTVENESGWLPFMIQQWDYYFRRFRGVNPPPITRDPSEYVRNQVFSCFFNDSVCGRNLAWWGEDNLMWSNDYPHANSTWPNSIKVIRRDLGHLVQGWNISIVGTDINRTFLAQAAAGDYEEWAFRGTSPEAAQRFRLTARAGVVVTDVAAGSSGEQAGLQPGDAILEVNRQPVTDVEAFKRIVASVKPGQTVPVYVQHGGGRNEYVVLTIPGPKR